MHGSGLNLGLALGGGGQRGMAHIGVLAALAEESIFPDAIAGTSVGALVGALAAFEVPHADFYAYAMGMNWLSITKPVLSRYGLVSNDRLSRIIKHFIGTKKIEEAPIPLSVVTTDIATGEEIVIEEGDVASAVVASSCIPGIFTPVTLGGRMLVDGGFSEVVPVMPLKKRGAAVVAAVDIMTMGTLKKPEGIIETISNAMTILLRKSSGQMLAQADIIIKPDIEHKLQTFIRTDKKHLQRMYDAGYLAGKRHAVEIHSWLENNKSDEPFHGFLQ